MIQSCIHRGIHSVHMIAGIMYGIYYIIWYMVYGIWYMVYGII